VPSYVKWLAFAVVVFIVILILAAVYNAISGPTSGNATANAPTPTDTPIIDVPTDTPVVPTYTPIILTPVATTKTVPVVATTFSGTGIKQTDYFTVPDNWTLNYTCYAFPDGTTGAMSVTVYGPNATPLNVAVNAQCAAGGTSDSTEEHQGGTIYLSINATGKWTITIQPHP